jgi:hypothetical protein
MSDRETHSSVDEDVMLLEQIEDEEEDVAVTTSAETTPSPLQNDDNCPICLQTLNEGHLIRRFSCGHRLHQTCITTILDKCPVCRKDLASEKLLCCLCGKTIPLVFTKGERIFQQCRECFRKTLADEVERVKRSYLTLYRIAVGYDKTCHDIDLDYLSDSIDSDVAYRRMRMCHVEMMDRLNAIISSSIWF